MMSLSSFILSDNSLVTSILLCFVVDFKFQIYSNSKLALYLIIIQCKINIHKIIFIFFKTTKVQKFQYILNDLLNLLYIIIIEERTFFFRIQYHVSLKFSIIHH